MRKILSSIMLIAVAAMASVSCQKEEAQAPETISTILTVHADVEATKTYLGEGNNVLWGKGEAVQLYVGVEETSKFVSSTSTDAYDGKASASFSFAIDGIEATGPYSLGGIYPASVALTDNDDPTKFKTILKQNQNAEVGKYDPSAYIMVLKPATVDALPTEYTASFRRATALNKVTLTNVAEDITSVEITVPADKYLAGRRNFDLTTGESADVYYDKSSTITVNSAFTGNSIDVWFCSWGVELAAGEELTITMKSATKSYTRTITAKENGIKFVEGNLNTLAINMADAVVENIVDFGGEWLITGTADGDVYAAKAYSTGNNLSSPVQITVAEDGSIDEVDGIEQCKMTFTKVTEGGYKGMYTIQDAGGKYLYAASSSSNHLKGGAAAESADYYWTVECNDGAYSIVASKSSNRNVMQFNPNSGNPLFSCYSSASQSPVTLYSYSMVKADTTPRITVEDTEYNVSADDETLEFGYTTKNIDGTPTVSVDGATMTNVEADAEAGIVTVIFDANAEEVEKTATLVLSYEGAESVSVTITQAAKAAEGGESGWISTPFANLKEGDQVVIVSTKNTDTWAMSNDKGTSSAPTGVIGVTYANGKLTVEPAENIIWYVGVEENNRIFYKDSGKDAWLYCTGTNNGVRVGTNTAKVFTFESNYLKHVGTSRYVGVYTTNPDWRCYTSINTNIQGQTFQFFVKAGEGGGETPEPELQERNLAFSSTTATATVGEDFTEPTLNGATAGVTYSSSNTSVATVDETTGAVTLVAAGETTITATAEADATYKAGEASYTLTVSAAQGGGDVGGDSVEQTATFNFKQIYIDNNNTTTSNVTVGDITFVGEKGTGSTPARAWSDGLRLYAGCKVTFKAADGYVITSISGDTALAFTGSQQTVEFSGLSKKTISANIVVTYKLQ